MKISLSLSLRWEKIYSSVFPRLEAVLLQVIRDESLFVYRIGIQIQLCPVDGRNWPTWDLLRIRCALSFQVFILAPGTVPAFRKIPGQRGVSPLGCEQRYNAFVRAYNWPRCFQTCSLPKQNYQKERERERESLRHGSGETRTWWLDTRRRRTFSVRFHRRAFERPTLNRLQRMHNGHGKSVNPVPLYIIGDSRWILSL